MVTALGIDVRKAFTLVFAIGGSRPRSPACSRALYFGTVDPQRGTSLLIFAFIVVVIGGLGSICGSALAAVIVALVQQFANYYASPGSATSRSCCCSRSCCSPGPGGARGAGDRVSQLRRRSGTCAMPGSCSSSCSRSCRSIGDRHPVLFRRP